MTATDKPSLTVADFEILMLEALPELRCDLEEYRLRKASDSEFTQTFFSYSFIPTLQVALDRELSGFCARAFELIEELVVRGDHDVRALLDDEFFGYGPHCEGWMGRASQHMGPRTRTIAEQNSRR